MFAGNMSENTKDLVNAQKTRLILEKFERTKILEVYFARVDGRLPDNIPSDHHELYEVELSDIKHFLLGQHPQDTILQKIFRMMS